MSQLYQALAQLVDGWRKENYKRIDFPVIGEILEWARDPDGSGFRLRRPQIRALETYWYLRLVEDTPHIFNLYKKLFPPEDPDPLLKALNIPDEAFKKSKYKPDMLWKNIEENDDFVWEFQLTALRETLTLDYSSYIFALAMGAGKTALIGAIFATEFGMAIEYPKGPFVQNALVFAPGKTIIESLRELAELPYDRILPARLYKHFAASVKLTFTRDGDSDIPIIKNSVFNVVVTNTEKIRIQKESIRKSDISSLFAPAQKEDEAKSEVANRRLRKIASLPHLAIFSDEAHHTYGQALDSELKKVRKTVDYLHRESPNLICVVNTTGTPYYGKQLLKDVVVWYGLSEGINQGILKDVSGNIYAYEFDNDVRAYLSNVIKDFFAEYGQHSLPDGTPAKLAIFFPQTNDVEELRPVVETALASIDLPSTLILEHHTKNENKADFDRFRSKDSPHRIALLVDRGVEGWNVPALFACALARKLKSSNNFVLQAASRCLRQVTGNTKKARIYLSMDNRSILDKQLQETYGETLDDLNHSRTNSRYTKIVLRKLEIDPIYVKQIIRTVVPVEREVREIRLTKPRTVPGSKVLRKKYALSEQASSKEVMAETGDVEEVASTLENTDVYTAAVDLASTYRLDVWSLRDELKRIYGESDITHADIDDLRRQIEAQFGQYELKEETVESGLALVKLDGFKKEEDETGNDIYVADISYPITREHLLQHFEKWQSTTGTFGFHYTPYNFDSNPEFNFFETILRDINADPSEIEDIYFTGAITDPKKTDFYIEYVGEDAAWHRYTPDFVIRKKSGKCLIVEIKDARFREGVENDIAGSGSEKKPTTLEGRKAIALKALAGLNPDKLKYEIAYAASDVISYEQIKIAKEELGKL